MCFLDQDVGERGTTHGTVVFAGPLFRFQIAFVEGESHVKHGFTYLSSAMQPKGDPIAQVNCRLDSLHPYSQQRGARDSIKQQHGA